MSQNICRGRSRTAAGSKMQLFVIIVNYYHKVLHLGCCSSPRSASDMHPNLFIILFVKLDYLIGKKVGIKFVCKKFATGKIICHFLPTNFFARLSENIN